MNFEALSLIELIVEKGTDAVKAYQESICKNLEALAETIENNIRKIIVDENPINLKYYENISALLDGVIELRRQKAIEYQEFLERIRELSRNVIRPQQTTSHYPPSMDTSSKRAVYDNFGKDEELKSTMRFVTLSKLMGWVIVLRTGKLLTQ